MENLNDSFAISKLIVKSFEGELSPEEQQTLDEWLADPKHRELYDSVRRKDLQAKQRQLASLSSAESWKRLERQIAFRPRLRPLHFLRYAAILLLPLLISSLLYIVYWKDARPAVDISVLSPSPGSPKATLILSSGEEVELEDLHIREDSSLRLENSNNTLKVETLATVSTGEASYQTLTIPIGGEYRLILSDGTKIWLNSDSRIRFPGTFSGDKRRVYLEGEAYFEVTHRDHQPFIVSTEGMEVEVLGTKFNVKAYAEDPVVYTTLAEGAVKTTDRASSSSLLLAPNQQCRYAKADGSMEKHPVDARVFTGWTEGKFIFENETLEEIMKQLNRWYATEVIYQSPELKNYRFTGYVDRFDQINTILHMIEKTYDIRFNVQGKVIVVGNQ